MRIRMVKRLASPTVQAAPGTVLVAPGQISLEDARSLIQVQAAIMIEEPEPVVEVRAEATMDAGPERTAEGKRKVKRG